MSSTPSIEPFRGSGTWEECNDFIRAIRAVAWKEGKLRDTSWMADFASLYFTHRALVWYSQLPEDVGQDWYKLQSSILTRWAPSEDDDGAKIEPTPAAAPSPKRNTKSDPLIEGVLRVVFDEPNAKYFINMRDDDVVCSLTADINKAIRVRCNSLSNGTLLERIDYSCHSWLAVHWVTRTPNIGDGSTDFARFTFFKSDTLRSSWTSDDKTPYQIIRCTVSTNGELSIVWHKDKTSYIPLSPFAYQNKTPLLVADPESYSRKYPNEKRVKLFIEPIE